MIALLAQCEYMPGIYTELLLHFFLIINFLTSHFTKIFVNEDGEVEVRKVSCFVPSTEGCFGLLGDRNDSSSLHVINCTAAMKRHWNDLHTSEPNPFPDDFVCEVCCKSYSTKQGLKGHKRIHVSFLEHSLY